MVARPTRDDVRQGIVAAATDAFHRDGYAGASLAGIADAAGYTKGAVYSGFGSKAELFAQVCRARFERVSAELLDAVRPALEGERDRGHLLTTLAEALTDTTFGPGGRWQLLMHDFQTVALHDADARAVYEELVAERVKFLVELFSSNAYLARIGRPALTRSSVLLLTMTTALAVEHALVPGTVDRASVVTSVHAILDAVLPSREIPGDHTAQPERARHPRP